MLTKPFLGVILFCEAILAYGLFPNYNKYNFYFGGSYDGLFHGNTTQFSIALQGRGGNDGGSQGTQQRMQPPAEPCGSAPESCPQTRYRSYDGSCNNLRNRTLGTPLTPYARLLPSNYGDGISSPTLAKSGRNLPLARIVSVVLFPDVPIEDPRFTTAAMQYGQLLIHDMSVAYGTSQSNVINQTRCCTGDGQLVERPVQLPVTCIPLLIPPGDVQAVKGNIQCMNFPRTVTNHDRRCVGGSQPAEQISGVNHYLDLSTVYGNNDEVNRNVREFQGGRLRVVRRNGNDWPPQAANVTAACPNAQSSTETCYLAGDPRANQNPERAVIQVILVREHNRLANALGHLNPHWNDERIFQQARRINIAEYQRIIYYEWLPIFLGVENSLKNRIVYLTKNFVNDYDENVNPSTINEHAHAAIRFFHSLIRGTLGLVTEHRRSVGNLILSHWYNRPSVVEEGDNFDGLSRSMTWEAQWKASQFMDSEITQFLFRKLNQTFGDDLRAFDVQRNRDHGLASYNDFRGYCGLPKAHSFEDFLDLISLENVEKLAWLYESPDDVELTVGASLENLVPGTLAGPVFLCILTEQFYRTRVGDRFFFENEGVNDFTLAQLNEIRKSSISRLFCDNGNNIKSMQPRGFELVNHENDVVPCEKLPAIDLSLWQENSGNGVGHSHYSFPGHEYLKQENGGNGVGHSHYNFPGHEYLKQENGGNGVDHSQYNFPEHGYLKQANGGNGVGHSQYNFPGYEYFVKRK